MNILKKAGDDVEAIVIDFLDKTSKKLDNYKEHLSLKGKNIEVANVEQAAYLAYYDEMRCDVKSLLTHFEMRQKEVKSLAWKTINDHAKLSHSDREKDILVNTDPALMRINRIYNQVKELYEVLNSIVEQFRDRSFSLNNIVKIRVASLEGISIYD